MISAKFKLLFLLLPCVNFVSAQELNARVTVNSSRIGTTVNKNTFQTLQTALNTFLNNRKWSKDVFLVNEKIDCNFFLNLQPTNDVNVYTASLTIQAARPVFNTSYLSP